LLTATPALYPLSLILYTFVSRGEVREWLNRAVSKIVVP
jgi:hypothetical protein